MTSLCNLGIDPNQIRDLPVFSPIWQVAFCCWFPSLCRSFSVGCSPTWMLVMAQSIACSGVEIHLLLGLEWAPSHPLPLQQPSLSCDGRRIALIHLCTLTQPFLGISTLSQVRIRFCCLGRIVVFLRSHLLLWEHWFELGCCVFRRLDCEPLIYERIRFLLFHRGMTVVTCPLFLTCRKAPCHH